MTGLSGSGKSTISVLLEHALVEKQQKPYFVYRLDGDNLRFGLNSDLGFSPEDRKENVRRVVESRDPKGLYKKARAGQIKGFTGLDAPYEQPDATDIHIHTDTMTIAEAVNHIMERLDKLGLHLDPEMNLMEEPLESQCKTVVECQESKTPEL